jgi:hypothetical protein
MTASATGRGHTSLVPKLIGGRQVLKLRSNAIITASTARMAEFEHAQQPDP